MHIERELPEEDVLFNGAGGRDAARTQRGEQPADDGERFAIRTSQHGNRTGQPA